MLARAPVKAKNLIGKKEANSRYLLSPDDPRFDSCLGFEM
jgi:hypothetical protein